MNRFSDLFNCSDVLVLYSHDTTIQIYGYRELPKH